MECGGKALEAVWKVGRVNLQKRIRKWGQAFKPDKPKKNTQKTEIFSHKLQLFPKKNMPPYTTDKLWTLLPVLKPYIYTLKIFLDYTNVYLIKCRQWSSWINIFAFDIIHHAGTFLQFKGLFAKPVIYIKEDLSHFFS